MLRLIFLLQNSQVSSLHLHSFSKCSVRSAFFTYMPHSGCTQGILRNGQLLMWFCVETITINHWGLQLLAPGVNLSLTPGLRAVDFCWWGHSLSQLHRTIAGVSLMFSAGGQLVFTGRQNYFSWTPLQEKLPSTCRLSNQAGKVVFTPSQFAQSMALNETSVPHKENNCLNHNQTSIKWPPINRPTFIWWPVPKVLRIFLLYTVIKTSIQWPPLSSSCGQLLAIPRLIYFKFALCLY